MEETVVIGALSALAHEGRLSAFRLLVRRAPEGVAAGEIADALGVRATTLSNQLTQLETAGLVRSRRDGRSIRYAADLDQIGGLLRFLAADCCRGRPEACLSLAPPVAAPTGASGRKPGVLFLCTGNSARSIFAEAILTRYARERFDVYSAGSRPKGAVDPRAAALLTTLGYDPTPFSSKSWDAFSGPDAPPLDFVFTVCDQAANEPCPVWPDMPATAHWGVPDPAAATGTDAEIALAYADAYRALYNRIKGFSNLPFAELDRLALQRSLDGLGRLGPDDVAPGSDGASDDGARPPS